MGQQNNFGILSRSLNTPITTSRCGIVFVPTKSTAQATAYTTNNIKRAWRATGIVPYNPNAVLTKLPGYKPHPRAVPKVPTTPHSFKLLQTLKNRRELRQQTLSAIECLNADPTISGTTKESSITLLRRLAHQSEYALTRGQIAEIEAADVR